MINYKLNIYFAILVSTLFFILQTGCKEPTFEDRCSNLTDRLFLATIKKDEIYPNFVYFQTSGDFIGYAKNFVEPVENPSSIDQSDLKYIIRFKSDSKIKTDSKDRWLPFGYGTCGPFYIMFPYSCDRQGHWSLAVPGSVC